MRILICGLPGSGKTTLASELVDRLNDKQLNCLWFNADDIRKLWCDWDFSAAGRMRQTERMRLLADKVETPYVVCDFVAPTKELREAFDADYTIWMNTETASRYADTDALFETPESANFIVMAKEAKLLAPVIARDIRQRSETSYPSKERHKSQTDTCFVDQEGKV